MGLRAFVEQGGGVVGGEHPDGVAHLGLDGQRLAARRDRRERGAGADQPPDERRRAEDVLEVVDDEQQMLGAQEARDRLLGRLAGERDDPESGHDGLRDVLVAVERRERDEARAVRVVRLHRARRLDGEPRLADAARARQGQQPHLAAADPGHDRAHVVVAADHPVGGRRQSARTAGRRLRARRGEPRCELIGDDLVEPLGAVQVLEPMLADVVERDADAGAQLGDDELARGAGDEHLAAVRGRADARGAMDVHADVVVGADLGLAGVQAHAHAQVHALGPGVGRQRTLRGHRRGDGVGRARRRRRRRRPRCGPLGRRAPRSPRAGCGGGHRGRPRTRRAVARAGGSSLRCR